MDGLTAIGLRADAHHSTRAFRALPDEAPLAMPVQSLTASPAQTQRPASSPRTIGLRRLVVIGSAVAMTTEATHEMYRVVAVNGLTLLGVLVLGLFVALFAWIALSFTSALAGFGSLLAGGGCRLGTDPDAPLPKLATRTALLMPTYNESPARVTAALRAMHESLEAIGAVDSFDIFILSDTTDPAIWIAEEAAFLELRERTEGHARIFYRRRPANTERKAGNIADWVRRFGAAYPQMLILDADSLMSGEAIVRLVDAMERHQDVGLIQTLPVIVNGRTLFARAQQFASRVYGPLIGHGIAWWHGAEGNYWGHNAVIRTRAFAEQAGLPQLGGPKPFGGHILSHDFVEAALLRRGGWAVHMVPRVAGSYEESPPGLIDLAIRDRRWCQGNLQHSVVIPARGLHWISRLHLLMGIGSYITAPLWLLFLLIGMLISLEARFVPPNYFPHGHSLFPQWPVIDPTRAEAMFVGTMGVLLAPKLLGWFALLFNASDRRGCGGALRAACSILLESLISGLLAPVTMLTQSGHVIAILLGRDAGWTTQRRDESGIRLRDIVLRYWRHTALGLAFGLTAYLISPYLALWMLPVVIGMALAIPLAALTGRAGPGLALARLGLLRTPEEGRPPNILAGFRRAHRERRDADWSPAIAVRRLCSDPRLLDAHRAMLPPARRPRSGPLNAALAVGRAKLDEAEDLDEAIAALTAPELAAVLADAASLERLSNLFCAGRAIAEAASW
jgi:membrane glycosyltransferase